MGKFVFNYGNNKLDGQSEGAADNRQRFIAFLNALENAAMNAVSQKMKNVYF